MNQQVDIEKKSILDIPKGWGDTPEEFKAQVIQLIKQSPLGTRSPKYDIKEEDGSTTPFYPIFCAVSPEWNILTREEVYALLYSKFLERVNGAYISATRGYADHIWDDQYLAWGLEKNIFSPEQLQLIRFDHGDTSESYVKQYGNPTLLENIMDDAVEKLIYPFFSVPMIREKVIEIIDEHCY